jgi:hypothetical protein
VLHAVIHPRSALVKAMAAHGLTAVRMAAEAAGIQPRRLLAAGAEQLRDGEAE